jgi:transposase-like protein
MTTKEQILALFTNLTGPEKQELIEELSSKEVFETVLVEDTPVICCPHCNSKLFVKNGTRGGLQKYRCKTCCKIFTSNTGTALHRIQNKEKYELYRAMMMDSYHPLKKIAKKVGISIQTAFDWRHKILSTKGPDHEGFDGITEIDDIWFLYSQKGRKGLDYSRKRGGSKRAGDNDFQAKLLITSDRKSKTDLSLVRIGRIKKSDIQRKISGKLSENCILVSDKHRSIASFAKSEGIEHVSFISSEHTAGGEFHVQNVNNMASRLKHIINHSLRGVSTKYLQSYANWFKMKSIKNINIEKPNDNKNVSAIHQNREGIYKRFIENFSRRTYRCPVKRHFVNELNPERFAQLQYI